MTVIHLLPLISQIHSSLPCLWCWTISLLSAGSVLSPVSRRYKRDTSDGREPSTDSLCFSFSGFCGVLGWYAGYPVDLIFSSTLVGGFNASSKGAPVGFPVSSAALPLLTPSHLLPYTGGLPTISKASFTSSFLMSFTDTQWEPPAHSTLTTSIGP